MAVVLPAGNRGTDRVVDHQEFVLVVDTFNHRVVRWRAASREGEVSHGVGGGLVSFSPLDRANFTGLVLGCVEAKFCKLLSKYALESFRRDLHDALLCTALQTQFLVKHLPFFCKNIAKVSNGAFKKIWQQLKTIAIVR